MRLSPMRSIGFSRGVSANPTVGYTPTITPNWQNKPNVWVIATLRKRDAE
jgi:hypothetical protein